MPQQQLEENAQRILKALEKGDTSQAQIDSQAHFFASYLVMLGCLAARLEPDAWLRPSTKLSIQGNNIAVNIDHRRTGRTSRRML